MASQSISLVLTNFQAAWSPAKIYNILTDSIYLKTNLILALSLSSPKIDEEKEGRLLQIKEEQDGVIYHHHCEFFFSYSSAIAVGTAILNANRSALASVNLLGESDKSRD